jgi:6-pyruvoyltetrahydropterin/6-carboxytetrahydropterin synthase
MQSITVSATVSMGHRLKDYNGACRNPHGHNMKIEVEVSAGVTFLDFKEVQRWLFSKAMEFDHAMLLGEGDPLISVLEGLGFDVYITDVDPTTEHIAEIVFAHMQKQYRTLRVTVFETDKYSATVRA